MSDLGVPPQHQVHLGVWTNWSQGKILGSTITVSQRHESLLIAFIALFVSYVGTCVWRIACFLIHSRFSSNNPQDGIYHQRQAILRNSGTGTSALWNLAQMLWFWRGNGRLYGRLLPLALYTVIIVSAFTVAGVFSSNIAALTGTEVLISGSSCGKPMVPLPSNITFQDYFNTYEAYATERMTSFLSYAQNCYADIVNKENCNSYVKVRLPSTISKNTSCPFKQEICRTAGGNIKFDTGYLDSFSDLGLNAPASKRVLFRRIMHCAPLESINYTDTFVYPNTSIEAPYTRYYYGPILTASGPIHNYTYLHALLSMEKLHLEIGTTAAPDYGLHTKQALTFNGSILTQLSDVQPIDALRRNDADVLLIFLSSSGIAFSDVVNDYWYSAHQPARKIRISQNLQGAETYMADEPASAIGCAIQYQLCNPNVRKGQQCSLWGGISDKVIPAESEEQHNTTQWILDSSFETYDISAVVARLRNSFLVSRDSLSEGIQGPLPIDQWQVDLERLHDVSLVAIQGSAVDTATDPTDPKMRKFLTSPSTEYGKYLCRNQKIHSTAYMNFSVFGLSFIFAVGGLLIVSNFILEPSAQLIRKRRQVDQYSNIEWCTNGTLQLQRLAHEELGLGNWKNCDRDIPVSQQDDRLAILDLQDPTHPSLMAPLLGSRRMVKTPSQDSNKEESVNQIEIIVSPSEENLEPDSHDNDLDIASENANPPVAQTLHDPDTTARQNSNGALPESRSSSLAVHTTD